MKIILIIFLLIVSIQAESNTLCEPTTNLVVYINGINNTEREAKDNLAKIAESNFNLIG